MFLTLEAPFDLPVAEIEACENNGLQFPFLGDVFVGHVPHEQVDEDHVGRVDKSNVLKDKKTF